MVADAEAQIFVDEGVLRVQSTLEVVSGSQV
jgi:hypothetical protein